jgi:hypothetical protein
MPVARRRPSGLYAARGRITPTPPFEFDRSLSFIERFTPAEGEQTVEDGVLTKAIRTAGQTLTFRIRSTERSMSRSSPSHSGRTGPSVGA